MPAPQNQADRLFETLPELEVLVSWDQERVNQILRSLETVHQQSGESGISEQLESLQRHIRQLAMFVDDVVMDKQGTLTDLLVGFKKFIVQNAAFREFCRQALKSGTITVEQASRWDERATVYAEFVLNSMHHGMQFAQAELRLGSDGQPYIRSR